MSRIERSKDGTIVVNPPAGRHQATVVLMHGLGDTANGWIDIAEEFAELPSLSHVKFILPTAESGPVKVSGGAVMPRWYDITSLGDRADDDCPGLEDSVGRIRRIIANEHDRGGLPYSRIALAGFSQGGAMSLATGLTFQEPLAGLLVLSGYLAAAKRFVIAPAQLDTPVLHCHGNDDPVVRLDWAVSTKQKIEALGHRRYTLKVIPRLPHSVNDQVLSLATTFLAEILPYDPAFVPGQPSSSSNSSSGGSSSGSTSLPPLEKPPAEMSVKELKAAVAAAGLNAEGLAEKADFVRLLEEAYRKS